MPYADPERERKRNRERMRRKRADAAYREEVNRRNSKWWREKWANDPEWREREHQRNVTRARGKYANDPDWRARQNGKAHTRRARIGGGQAAEFTPEQWAAKVSYWGDRCWVCGGPWSAQDHVKPLAAGGAHLLCNVRPICKPCNSAKRDKWLLLRDRLGVHRRPSPAAPVAADGGAEGLPMRPVARCPRGCGCRWCRARRAA